MGSSSVVTVCQILTNDELPCRLPSRWQRPDVVIRLLRHFQEAMVKIRYNSRDRVVGGGEEHGVHLKFQCAAFVSFGCGRDDD